MRLRTWSCGHVGFLVQPVADVLGDRQRIEQRALLEQHADVAAHAHEIALGHAIDALAIDENRAGVGPKQSENELEHDGLPAAAGAEQDLHASLRDAETDIAKDDVLVEGERDLVEHHGGRDSVLLRHQRADWCCPARICRNLLSRHAACVAASCPCAAVASARRLRPSSILRVMMKAAGSRMHMKSVEPTVLGKRARLRDTSRVWRPLTG